MSRGALGAPTDLFQCLLEPGRGQHAGLAGRVQRSEELANHAAGLIADFAA